MNIPTLFHCYLGLNSGAYLGGGGGSGVARINLCGLSTIYTVCI